MKPIPLGEGEKAGFVEALVVGGVEVDDVEGVLAPPFAQPCDQFPPLGADLRGR